MADGLASSPVQVAFLNWLSMNETPTLVESVIERHSSPLQQPCSPRPPHSPLSRALTKGRVFRGQKVGPGQIKQFYFPGGTPLSPSSRSREERSINEFFLGPAAFGHQTCTPGRSDAESHPAPNAALTRDQFRVVTKQIAQLPSHCNTALFDAVNGFDEGSSVSMTAFKSFWEAHLQTCDRVTRLFRTLGRSSPALERWHFESLVRDVVLYHPGLRFLADSQQFQDKYVETVITRIFYNVNRSGNGRITLGELRSSNLLYALDRLDQEDDINEVNQYFSYEHFYVIYCKFWEIDHDHDFLITRDDLAKYVANSLLCLDRIFEVALRHPPAGGKPNDVMTYEDFIYFLLSEEDKSSPAALDFWFRVCDIDGDGLLTVFEIEMFYKAQSVRIHHVSHEHISLNDFVCQLMDIVKPDLIGQITRADLRRCKLVRVFFNMLLNLDKFIQYESRDASLIEQIRATPEMTDWDRFAIVEYSSYSEADNAGNDLQDDAAIQQSYEGIMEPFSESMMVEQNELLS